MLYLLVISVLVVLASCRNPTYQSKVALRSEATLISSSSSNNINDTIKSISSISKPTSNSNNNSSNIINSNSCGFAYYSQCDSQWADIPLGTSSTNTICSAGCAMSSTAMMLSHYGTTLNPEQLNQWLNDNNGYEDGDLLVWSSVDTFGPSFQGIETGVSVDTLANGISECHGIIANVRDGSHWVLLTGYAGNDNFYVNDPGFDDSTYAYSDMSQWAVYH